MKLNKALLFALFLLSITSLTACSGPKRAGCVTNCGGGTTAVSLTLRSDAPLPSPSIISFRVIISGITLNTAAGTSVSLNPNPLPVIELTRLQSDSAFLGTFPAVPVGTYVSATVSFSTPIITFLNNSNATVSGCLVNQICTVTLTGAGNPTITTAVFPLTLVANNPIGLSLDFHMSNALSIVAGALTASFSPTPPAPSVLSVIALPTPNPTLAANQLDLIEDFVGVVSSIVGQTITVRSATRGTLTATATANTRYDAGPDIANPICVTLDFSCVQLNRVVSIDAVLNKDGTLSIQQFEPLANVVQDVVEGTVVSINQLNPAQFTIILSEKTQAAQASLIAGLNVGDPLQVSIVSPKPFQVDTKGLLVSPATLNLFAGGTTTAPLRLGQTVAVRVNSFISATPLLIASATTDIVILRWSRFTATASAPFTPTTFNVKNLPGYFFRPLPQQVQTFAGTPGADGVTNYDGILDPTGLVDSSPVALRALFIENSTDTATFAFFASKVRKP